MHELIWIVPFLLLLGCIAILPLVRKHWWEKNYAYLSFGLAALIVVRYVFFLEDSASMLHVGVEYISFICLIAALFVVAGGIHIQVKGEATPLVNTLFLAIGAVAANFLGTTGASMVLIRPWLRMNKFRLTAHHIVFFIFIVSNVGGALTPIGDPPLFLGYLQGVPFFWVLREVWLIWLVTVVALISVFFVVDTLNFRKSPADVRAKETAHEEWRFSGLHNLVFLAVIIGSVFINHPLFLREAIMVCAAVLSYKTTARIVHKHNDFNFAPMREVAILFFGIFCTMVPALAWLEHNAANIGVKEAGQFYWASGVLSSVLDNAPTYLNFLTAALGLFGLSGREGVQVLLQQHPEYVRAVSVASVFFGAVTYIGNGPNLLVKSIADASGGKAPSFFGYLLRYALPILIPIYALVWLVFFRG